MRQLRSWYVRSLLLLGMACTAALANSQPAFTQHACRSVAQIESATPTQPALRDALRLVFEKSSPPRPDLRNQNIIIVGFVGGFVKATDLNHPEVLFATYLRDRYCPNVHAEVFANHQGKKALSEILRLLDRDRDGSLTAAEKSQAAIVIYGHSWGGSQTVALARQLDRWGIPVRLTVQIDSVDKLGQHDSVIPPNVENAINFYQSRGPLHGQAKIRAADPARTKILGNFQMSYEHRHIDCANYPWLARTFNKPHHKIENDPLVWDRVATLIDFTLSSRVSQLSAIVGSASSVAK